MYIGSTTLRDSRSDTKAASEPSPSPVFERVPFNLPSKHGRRTRRKLDVIMTWNIERYIEVLERKKVQEDDVSLIRY